MLSILLLSTALLGVLGGTYVLLSWRRADIGGVGRPTPVPKGDVEALFEKKRPRRGGGGAGRGYDEPMEIDWEEGLEETDLDDFEDGQEELAPPPMDFDGENPDHPNN
jgi:hypothetical protein